LVVFIGRSKWETKKVDFHSKWLKKRTKGFENLSLHDFTDSLSCFFFPTGEHCTFSTAVVVSRASVDRRPGERVREKKANIQRLLLPRSR